MPRPYHRGSRALQDRHDTRRIADRLNEVTVHHEFTPADKAFIESRDMFFLATADDKGQPSCSYKGGDPGFVRVLDTHTLAFPNYDGNGMYISFGNVLKNKKVGMLFIDFERRTRMRVEGEASLGANDPLRAQYPGAQFIVYVKATVIYPNCPRYIHHYQLVERSVFVPRAGQTPPVPDWKRTEWARDALPKDDPANAVNAAEAGRRE